MKRRTCGSEIRLIILIVPFLFCSPNSPEEHSESLDVRNDPFGTVEKTTEVTMVGTIGSINDGYIKSAKLSESPSRTIGNTTYEQWKVGDVTGPGMSVDSITGPSTDVWVDIKSNGALQIGGFKDKGLLSSVPLISILGIGDSDVTFKEPLFIDPEEQPLKESRTATVEANLGSLPLTVDLTYTPVEENATAITTLGPLSGCRRIHVEGAATDSWIPAALKGVKISGDGWYHSDMGFVAFDIPLLGIDASLADETDYGDAETGFNVIRKVSSVHPGETFELSTYERNNELDADKNTHAKMLLEVRWADTTNAKTMGAPDPLTYPVVFGTVWGTFVDSRWGTPVLVESPVSIFHPEENGKGYTFYYCFVDQAAKNEPGSNGIEYKISVSNNGSNALRCTARIGYTIIEN
ncbi:MAG: hypothetical protein GF401_02365 [Chitinivibrionales bacterium]|nr:hypothetical protein [Chitinivibrionales bacterium]